MKNIVIAAGYATRLYPLTENFPKPLLEIGNNTILGRLIDDIDRIEDINEHIIVTNHKFAGHFEVTVYKSHSYLTQEIGPLIAEHKQEIDEFKRAYVEAYNKYHNS